MKGRSQLPGMVEDAMKGDIDLEPFVTHTMSLDEINDANESIRKALELLEQPDFEGLLLKKR